ncbi:MAG: hypothetical protein ACYTFA_17420 [Planctomycetota bacterium]
MRLKSPIAVAVLLSAGIPSGEAQISVDPPQPLDTTPVVVRIASMCESGCAFDCKAVGKWINTTVYVVSWDSAIWGYFCPLWCVPFVREFELGVLPVGDYRIGTEWYWFYDPSRTCCLDDLLYVNLLEPLTFHVYAACDMDQDRDVDLVDSAEFGECLSGPTSRLDGLCARGDTDGDDDVDLKDYAILQRGFTG